jgi:hypothetical protein
MMPIEVEHEPHKGVWMVMLVREGRDNFPEGVQEPTVTARSTGEAPAGFVETIAKMAIPYEALLADAESREWIAPSIWEAIGTAVATARDILSRTPAPRASALREVARANIAQVLVDEGIRKPDFDGRGWQIVDRLLDAALASRPAAAPAPAEARLTWTAGTVSVANERKRQIEAEGWTTRHDDGHSIGDLAHAGICYAECSSDKEKASARTPIGWPWHRGWWKPKDRRSNLVRAAALIIAEIDRLDRAALAAEGKGEGNE